MHINFHCYSLFPPSTCIAFGACFLFTPPRLLSMITEFHLAQLAWWCGNPSLGYFLVEMTVSLPFVVVSLRKWILIDRFSVMKPCESMRAHQCSFCIVMQHGINFAVNSVWVFYDSMIQKALYHDIVWICLFFPHLHCHCSWLVIFILFTILLHA